jgi:adenosine deaminase
LQGLDSQTAAQTSPYGRPLIKPEGRSGSEEGNQEPQGSESISMSAGTKLDRSWFERIPKVELHLHLEGAIPHAALWELMQKYGGDPSVPTLEALPTKFTYGSFSEFIDTWVWKNTFLRRYEDFEFIAEAIASDLAGQNIRYVEAFYSPGDYLSRGLDAQLLTQALRAGLDRCKDVKVALVADLIRDHGPERGAKMLRAVNEVRDLGVIGVGIGGSESEFPPEAFEEVFDLARGLGFHTSAHAGEAAGPESVWGAISALRVDRIGHATRAVEDPKLLDYLAEHQIPLELCPISNLKTRVIDSIGEHPARLYFEKGIPLSINTDDPKMFGNALADEYLALGTEMGFSRREIEGVILQGISTSWLCSERKEELISQFESEPATARDKE